MEKIKTPIILLLTILGFSVFAYNLYVANITKYNIVGDSSGFLHRGIALAKTGKYGHLDLSPKELIQGFKERTHSKNSYEFISYSSWRPPLWPLLIGFCFIISGYSLAFLILVKFLLHLIGGWFFYKTLGYFRVIGLLRYLGFILYIVNPAWQIYSRVFLSEPLTLFLMTVFIWSTVRFMETDKSFWLNGVIGGLLILSHPYYFFLPFSIWFFLFLYRKLSFSQIFILSGIASILVSVWIIRNYFVFDANKFFITTSTGVVLAKGWNKNVPKLHTNTQGDLADERLVLEGFKYKESDYTGQIGLMELYQDATINFVVSNPELIFPIILKKLKSAFDPFPETPLPGILEKGRVAYHLLSFLALIILLLKGSPILKSFVLGLLMSTFLITIITYSGFRFRMPQSILEILFVVVVINILLRTNKYEYLIIP